MDMCLNEAMRLYPPGFQLDRVCNEDIEVGGVHIPKGMTVSFPVVRIKITSCLTFFESQSHQAVGIFTFSVPQSGCGEPLRFNALLKVGGKELRNKIRLRFR